jgi:crotonobetainyl-CoA:carnitine CoA-transferase CaiB-like acyl-CoA transferase
MTTTAPSLSLDGVRVLDLSRVLAGPFCGMLLSDLGADVVKIEAPIGDLTRYAEPFLSDDEERPFGGYFHSVNRNKRSVVLDLKQPEARDVVLRMVPAFDAVVENYRLGVMERFGLGYEALRDLNSKLVYASIRGFGDPRGGASPYAEWPAFDVSAQAFGGFMGITGPQTGEPQQSGPGIGDIFPGTLCALGITSALLHAHRTGEGQYVDVAMYDAMIALCERIIYQYSIDGESPRPQGNTHPHLYPFGVFPASDGHVSIATPTNRQWRLLCAIIERPEIAEDERYRDNPGRVAHRAEVSTILSGWTSTRTKAEIVAALGGEVPVGPVNNAQDIFDDPHVKAREMLASVEHPGSNRTVTIAGSPIKFTETPAGVRHRAPLLGEHTDEILADAGFTADEIASLRSSEVIR